MSRRSPKLPWMSNTDGGPDQHLRMTVLELVHTAARKLQSADVSFGHGTSNALDEAAWLVLWKLGLPLDCNLDSPDSPGQSIVTAQQHAAVETLVCTRIQSRLPTAYLTREAWVQGLSFYADERAIVPRSLIAELLTGDGLDYWLPAAPLRVLDLCTGGGSLAVLAAMAWSGAAVDAADVSEPALEVAAINIDRHALGQRVRLLQGDGLAAASGRYDLILCNPPYVNAASMAALPPEYQAEPGLALAGGADGMDFVRGLVHAAHGYMEPHAVLVLEIGNERANFEAAFAGMETIWLETSAGDAQVCLLTRAALGTYLESNAANRPHSPTP